MKLTPDIKKILRRGRSPQSAFGERSIIHPVREWMLGLLVVSVTFVSVAIYFGYDFYVHLHDDGTNNMTPPESVTYRQSDVTSILTSYREQAKQFETLRKDKSNYVTQEPQPSVESANTSPLAEDSDEQYSDGAAIGGRATE